MEHKFPLCAEASTLKDFLSGIVTGTGGVVQSCLEQTWVGKKKSLVC